VSRFGGIGCALLIVGAATIAARAQTPASGTQVADVIPQGLHLVPTPKVMSLIHTRPGADYSEEVVREDVRRLYETHSFSDIRVELNTLPDNRVVVNFWFREMPSVIREIVFKGANHLSKDDLEQATGLKKGAPLNPVANQLACQAIIRKYQEKGRMWASVDLIEGDKPGDSRVVFSITEGPIAQVSKIEFIGNTFEPDAVLRIHVDTSQQFLSLPFGAKFNEEIANHDVKNLEEYYRKYGYFDVVVRREYKWDPDQRHVHVIFHIHEGQRYKVANVDVVRNNVMDRKSLLELATMHSGEVYSKQKSEVTKAKFQAAYGYRGYNPTIIERVAYREQQPGQVDVYYEFEEKPIPNRVGNVHIVGNVVTRDNVIRRQLEIYPGQILEWPNLKQAEVNLARLNIFEMNQELGIRPTVTVIDPESDSIYKDILVSVQEARTGSLLFGVGVNSDAGLTGSIVLNERNFDILRPPTSWDDLLSGRAWRGAGQEFRIEAVPGTQVQRYVATFREPYLFDSLYSLTTSGYFYDRIYNEDVEQRLGTRITIGRQLNRYWAVSGGLRVENVGIHNVAFFAPQDYQRVVGDNFLVGFRGDVTYDSRDSFLRPTEGMKINAGFEQVTGDFTFPVFTIEGNKYFTVWQRADGSGRHVLAARSMLGIAGSHTPVYERFYAGGFSSMRGFEFRGVGPDINGFKVGGDFMFLNSLEYQIPVRANDQIYFVGFLDTGTVEPTVNLNNYRVSAGVGMRITIPMMGPVPIALDFGFPIVKAPEDRKQLFSFWVGFFGH
jgi:outer membrane protein assembly complex protein YaeT